MEKGKKMSHRGAVQCILFIIAGMCLRSMKCNDESQIPADRGSVNSWFQQNLKSTLLNAVLQTAEETPQQIKVGPNGQFKTITEALKSIPSGNTQRININIAKGVYNERVKVERTKPFITFNGEPGTIIQAAGNAKKFGTFDSATVIVESDYFIAHNIIFKNTAPQPTKEDAASKSSAAAQAVAFRIGGDFAAFYDCKFYGYQDTLCDEKGRHLFKDCYIEGTVDFIFGFGKSLYLLSEIHVLKQAWNTVITAQGKQETFEDSGFSFVHCTINGDVPQWSYLGRAWMKRPEVVFAYCTMNNGIYSVGWEAFGKAPAKFFFGEYKNTGPGAAFEGRAPFAKQLDAAAAKRFLNLGYVQASRWLLPPSAGGSPMSSTGRRFVSQVVQPSAPK